MDEFKKVTLLNLIGTNEEKFHAFRLIGELSVESDIKNVETNQQLTESEIEQVEMSQALTDAEIAIAELQES